MIRLILRGKYDIKSFGFAEEFIVTVSSPYSIKRLNFGDRIVYTKFYEEELSNKATFPYYDVLGDAIRTTTLLQELDSSLLKRIESDTGNLYSAAQLNHYILISENHIMEIVSFDEVKEETP